MPIVLKSTEVDISHEEAKKLRLNGQLNLGVNDNVSLQLIKNSELVSNPGIKYAYYFWHAVALLILVYTIFLSVTERWWVFIIGLLIYRHIVKINKRSNSENLMNEALENKMLYQFLIANELVLFELDESIATQYVEKTET